MEEQRAVVAEQANLIPEYQACQADIQTIDMRLWQSAAILIGASFATLAVLAGQDASTPFCAGVSLAALAAVTIFGLWTRIWMRRDASVEALETRMREIEWRTGMRKVIYFGVLRRWDAREQMEDWQRLSPGQRAELEAAYRPLPRPNASFMLFATAMIALAGWPALAIAKTVELAAK